MVRDHRRLKNESCRPQSCFCHCGEHVTNLVGLAAPASVRDFGVADLKKSEPQMFVDSNDDVRAETGDKFPRHIYHSSSAKMIGNSRRLECLIYPRKPRRFNERRIILVARFNHFERN